MVKLIAMYKKPQDAATFDQVYFGEHITATAKMPGLRRAEINKVVLRLAHGRAGVLPYCQLVLR